jgi:hypothetical protein
MKRRLFAISTVVIGLSIVSTPMFAHHGWSLYDGTKTLSISGTVSDFEFVNPHVQVFFDVRDDKGKIENWVGEATSPNILIRNGIRKNTLKSGDRVTAIGHPARNGSYTILIEKIMLSNGKEVVFETNGF